MGNNVTVDGGMDQSPTPQSPGPKPAPPTVVSSWQFEHPSPQGNALHAIWASPTGSEAWAVGEFGAIVRIANRKATWEGAGSTTATLRAVAVAGKEVWAVGDSGLVARGQGSFSTQLLGTDPLYAIAVRGDTVYLAGKGNVLWSYSPQGGYRQSTLSGLPKDGAVRAAIATDKDLYLVGTSGRILHQLEDRWFLEGDGLSTQDLNAVTIGEGGAVYAVGGGGRILRRDPQSTRWALEHPLSPETQLTRAELRSVFSVGTQLFALATDGTVLLRGKMGWESAGIAPGQAAGAGILRAAAGGTSGGYAVGDGGTILFRGAGEKDPFVLAQAGSQQTRHNLVAISAGDGVAYAATENGAILRRSIKEGAPTWSIDYMPLGQPLLGVFGRGDEAYAVGMGGVLLRRTGGTWVTESYTFPDRRPDLRAVWARGTDVYAVGSSATREADQVGVVLHKVGNNWTVERPAELVKTGLFSVAGNDTEVIAVGSLGVILRRSGGMWVREDNNLFRDIEILGVTAVGADFVAVGTQGTVLRRTQGKWTKEAGVPAANSLNAVAGLGEELWVSGQGGTVLRGRMGKWQPDPVLFGNTLFGIATTPTDIFAVGVGGVVLRRAAM